MPQLLTSLFRRYIPEISLEKITAYATIIDGNILTELFRRHISSGNCFLARIFRL